MSKVHFFKLWPDSICWAFVYPCIRTSREIDKAKGPSVSTSYISVAQQMHQGTYKTRDLYLDATPLHMAFWDALFPKPVSSLQKARSCSQAIKRGADTRLNYPIVAPTGPAITFSTWMFKRVHTIHTTIKSSSLYIAVTVSPPEKRTGTRERPFLHRFLCTNFQCAFLCVHKTLDTTMSQIP